MLIEATRHSLTLGWPYQWLWWPLGCDDQLARYDDGGKELMQMQRNDPKGVRARELVHEALKQDSFFSRLGGQSVFH
jgi:hypothetical protein